MKTVKKLLKRPAALLLAMLLILVTLQTGVFVPTVSAADNTTLKVENENLDSYATVGDTIKITITATAGEVFSSTRILFNLNRTSALCYLDLVDGSIYVDGVAADKVSSNGQLTDTSNKYMITNAGRLTVTLGDLAAGDTRVVTFYATIAEGSENFVLNNANLHKNNGDDFIMSSPITTSTPLVFPVKEYGIKTSENLTSTDGKIYVGDAIKYTVTAYNNSTSTTSLWDDVTVTDTLPEGMTFVTNSVAINGNTASEGMSEGQYTYDESSRKLTVYLGDIAYSSERTITFSATVDDNTFDETITNTATISGTDNGRQAGTAIVTVSDDGFTVEPATTPEHDLLEVIVTKTAEDTGEILSGAEFIIFCKYNGTTYYFIQEQPNNEGYEHGGRWTSNPDDAEITVYTSDAAGEFTAYVEPLCNWLSEIANDTVVQYYFQEKQAPEGYVLPDTPFPFDPYDFVDTGTEENVTNLINGISSRLVIVSPPLEIDGYTELIITNKKKVENNGGNNSYIYTVTYDPNGGDSMTENVDNKYTVLANDSTGVHKDTGLPYGTEYTVLGQSATGFRRDSFFFTGWNTESDGSGTSYTAGDRLTITGDVMLYAQWEKTSTGGGGTTDGAAGDATDGVTGSTTDDTTGSTTDDATGDTTDGTTSPSNITNSSGATSFSNITNPFGATNSPKTGDTSSIALEITLLCVSLSGIVYLLWVIRRSKKHTR